MNDKEITLFVIASFVLIVPLSAVLALWLVTGSRRISDQPLAQDVTGVVAIPVRQLRRRFRFFAHSQNGINPRLEIAPDGLRFKVFRPDHWAFVDIAEVDALPALFSTRLEVRSREHGRLFIDLANTARARDLLRALPPSVPLTPRAIAMRDVDG